MKILLLAPQPFYQVRGTPIAIDLLVSTLAKQGHNIDLLTYHEGDSRHYHDVRHIRTKAFSFLNGVKPGFSLKKLMCSGLLFLKAFGLLRRNQYDLVHANEEAVFMAWFYRLVFNVPYVYDMDSSLSGQMVDKMPKLKFLSSLMAKLEAAAMRKSIGVLAVCEALCKLARPHNDNVVVLSDVSMLDRLQPSKDIVDLGGTHGLKGTRFMYIGNLETYQGVDLMIEAFALALRSSADLSLIVIGGNEASIRHYQGQARLLRVDDAVVFAGPKPFDDIAEYMAQADVLLSPRIQGENTPMKIYNYMASGKAMIATDIYSHTQVLSERYASLVSVDPQSMSQAMLELASDADKRERLAAACKDYADKYYSVVAFERAVDDFFNGLISAKDA